MKSSKNSKFTLYKKEQLMLCILLFCFVLSGFCLPIIKDSVIDESAEFESSTEVLLDDESVEEEVIVDENAMDENVIDETVADEPSTDETVVDEPIIDEPAADKPTVDEPSTDKPTVDKPVSKPNNSEPESKPEPTPTPEPEPEPEPEKIWVPPVYETVHHEAVYETVRVIICNYCSEEFSSVGEFQVHKDEHGG